MRKHKFVPGTVTQISNRCWACDKGGSVGIHRLVHEIKDSSRPVHFNEKCIKAAKEKYRASSSGKAAVKAKA
jgi:hypothetical protein